MEKYTPAYSSQFKKDVKLIKKRGYDMDKLKSLAVLLLKGEPLPENCKDHALKGEFAGFRDAHIQPDWLLIYTVVEGEGLVRFERTGTHSDLFGM